MRIELNDKYISLEEIENLLILNVDSFYLEQLILKNDLLLTLNCSYSSFNFREQPQELISVSLSHVIEENYIIDNISFILENEKLLNMNTDNIYLIKILINNIEYQKESKLIVIKNNLNINEKLIKEINECANKKNIKTVWIIKDNILKIKYSKLFKHRIKEEIADSICLNGFKLNRYYVDRLNLVHFYGRKFNKMIIGIDSTLYRDIIRLVDFEKFKIEIEKNKLINQLDKF